MTPGTFKSTLGNGIWSDNPALVQLLGLSPVLAITDSAVKGLGLGAATLGVWVLSSATVSAMRTLIRPETRMLVFVLVIASFVTMVELVMSAYFYGLREALGIFVPLMAANCAIIGRTEAVASRQPVPRAILDGLAMGAGYAAVLVALGILREAAGRGTVFADAQLLFGTLGQYLGVELTDEPGGLLLAALPPGAFLGFGMFLALKNFIQARRAPAGAQSQ